MIQHNQQRHEKVLWSDKGDGETIEVFHTPNEIDEAQAVIKRIVKLKEERGLRWRDIAILYRSNALSRQFESALLKQTWRNGDQWVQGIPYEVVGGTEFYERREVKDLCAYLRVIVNPLDQEALLRIINQPRRGIGEETLDHLTAYNRQQHMPLWDVLIGVVKRDPQFFHLAFIEKRTTGLEDFILSLEEAKERFAQRPSCGDIRMADPKNRLSRAIKEEVKSQQMRDFKMDNVKNLSPL